ncbi:hypothetical protein ACYATO_07895 [Lactobacillaceae bacterium Melli_B3]
MEAAWDAAVDWVATSLLLAAASLATELATADCCEATSDADLAIDA